MKNEFFKCLIENYLFPLIPGSEFEKFEKSNAQKQLSHLDNGSRLGLKALKSDAERAIIARRFYYLEIEKQFCSNFLKYIKKSIELFDENEEDQEDYIQRSITNIIAGAFTEYSQTTVSGILNRYEQLSQVTYEGGRVSFSIAIDKENKPIKGKIDVFEIFDKKFSNLLTDGIETAFIVDQEGNLLDYYETGISKDGSKFSPKRYGNMSALSNNKLVLVLNRNGEILIFQDDKLVLAKRNASWRSFPNESIMNDLSFGRGKSPLKKFKESLYASILDASFQRSGACIGVIETIHINSVKTQIIPNDDLIENQSNIKNRLLHTTNMESFLDTKRKIMSELLSIDGALILDSTGSILAVGSIIKSNISTGEGARKAAAMTLASFGLGIKISEDGTVEVYSKDKYTGNINLKVSFG
jgi:hypothetical protein